MLLCYVGGWNLDCDGDTGISALILLLLDFLFKIPSSSLRGCFLVTQSHYK